MAQIPSWLWIIAGLAITITSVYVGGLQLFMYAGLLFFAFGVFQIIITWVTAKPTKEETRTYAPQHRIKYCQNCRTSSWATANFCYNCGTRLR